MNKFLRGTMLAGLAAAVAGLGLGAGGDWLQAAASPTASLGPLPAEREMPALDGATAWFNSPPLRSESLRGKVVLVDFWTHSCINCIRTLPYVRAWAEKYRRQGLVVIGVHTPEFAFEKDPRNVKKALAEFKIDYPVAMDNDYAVWRAFKNNYWPAFYLVDARGQIRYHAFGEGGYEQTEQAIQRLLAEAGSAQPGSGEVVPQANGAQAAPDLSDLASDETYIGYRHAERFAADQALAGDRQRAYTTGRLGLNQWGLSGRWTVGAERAALDVAGGGITYRFKARDLHLVLGPGGSGAPVRFRVTVDGQPPAADHGADVDAAGAGLVTRPRLYQLVRQAGEVRERVFEIRFLDPGVQAYAFTFG